MFELIHWQFFSSLSLSLSLSFFFFLSLYLLFSSFLPFFLFFLQNWCPDSFGVPTKGAAMAVEAVPSPTPLQIIMLPQRIVTTRFSHLAASIWLWTMENGYRFYFNCFPFLSWLHRDNFFLFAEVLSFVNGYRGSSYNSLVGYKRMVGLCVSKF